MVRTIRTRKYRRRYCSHRARKGWICQTPTSCRVRTLSSRWRRERLARARHHVPHIPLHNRRLDHPQPRPHHWWAGARSTIISPCIPHINPCFLTDPPHRRPTLQQPHEVALVLTAAFSVAWSYVGASPDSFSCSLDPNICFIPTLLVLLPPLPRPLTLVLAAENCAVILNDVIRSLALHVAIGCSRVSRVARRARKRLCLSLARCHPLPAACGDAGAAEGTRWA